MKKFGIKEVVAAGIGTALFVALTNVQIPVGFIPNTAFQPRAALLAFFAAVFGPIVGGIMGLLGHALGDALFGIAVGLFATRFQIKEGGFSGKQIAVFNIVQAIANAVCWIVIAPVLDVAIYAEPANKVFTQGAIAAVLNIIVVAVLGTLLAVGYSKLGAKSSSLSKED